MSRSHRSRQCAAQEERAPSSSPCRAAALGAAPAPPGNTLPLGQEDACRAGLGRPAAARAWPSAVARGGARSVLRCLDPSPRPPPLALSRPPADGRARCCGRLVASHHRPSRGPADIVSAPADLQNASCTPPLKVAGRRIRRNATPNRRRWYGCSAARAALSATPTEPAAALSDPQLGSRAAGPSPASAPSGPPAPSTRHRAYTKRLLQVGAWRPWSRPHLQGNVAVLLFGLGPLRPRPGMMRHVDSPRRGGGAE